MKLTSFSAVILGGAALLLSAVLPFPSLASPVEAVTPRDSQAELTRLLKQAQVTAGQLASTTDQLNAYSRSNLTWQTHAAKVDEVKSHVNALGRNLSEMEALQADATPWQDDAIRGIRPLLEQIADSTEEVILYIRENPRLINFAAYEEMVADKHDLASELAVLTKDYVSYGEAKDKLEQLHTELDLT